MILKKICKECGAEFETSANKKTYCSPECKKKAAARVRAEWVRKTKYNERRRVGYKPEEGKA